MTHTYIHTYNYSMLEFTCNIVLDKQTSWFLSLFFTHMITTQNEQFGLRPGCLRVRPVGLFRKSFIWRVNSSI